MTGYRISHTTKPIALRVTNEVYAILERKAQKQGKTVSDYLRARVNREIIRSHKKKE